MHNIAATDPEDVAFLGSSLNQLKVNIDSFREIRNWSLITRGSSLLIGGLMFLLTPDLDSIEAELFELRERLK